MTDEKRRLAGRYRIDGLLGRGGMSEVYFGYDERLDRPVAIKLLRPPSVVPAAPDSPGGGRDPRRARPGPAGGSCARSG